MKNIRSLKLHKYENSADYKFVEGNIYKDLHDIDTTNCRLALAFELEEGEDTQYPIEDVLTKYLLYVSDHLETEETEEGILKLELGGELDDIRMVTDIIGKRVYNKDFIGEDGQTYVDLIIE